MCDYSEEMVTSGVQVAKSPRAQNGVRTDSGAPGAALICHTGSTQRALQASLSGNHCARCFWETIRKAGATFGFDFVEGYRYPVVAGYDVYE